MTVQQIREVLSALRIPVKSRTHDGWLMASCPFAPWRHDKGTDRNPSFGISINDQGLSGYNCFACGQSGPLVKLVSALEYYRECRYPGLGLRVMLTESERPITSFDEGAAPWDQPKALSRAVHLSMYPMAWEEPRAREYLIKRGVNERGARKLDLRYDPEDQRVVFPIFGADDELYGFSGRTILEEADYPNARLYPRMRNYNGVRKANFLLGANIAEPGKPSLVIEGIIALAHLFSIEADRVCNPVAAMGAHVSEAQVSELIALNEPVVLLLDDDLAGDVGLYGPQDTAGKHRGGGAIDLLQPHLPVMVGEWPAQASEADAPDADKLTFDEVQEIIANGFKRSNLTLKPNSFILFP